MLHSWGRQTVTWTFFAFLKFDFHALECKKTYLKDLEKLVVQKMHTFLINNISEL